MEWTRGDRTGQSWRGFDDRMFVAQVVHYAGGWMGFIRGDPIDGRYYDSAEAAMRAVERVYAGQ